MNTTGNDFDDYDLLVRITWGYYVDKMTQDEIANILGFSRMKVQRLLQEALTKEVVTISIKNPFFNLLKMEKELISTFGLLDAVVVPTDEEHLLADLSRAAARYIQWRWLSKIKVIGVGHGETLSCLGNYFSGMSAKDAANISVVSLQGVLSPDAAWSSLDNAQKVAHKLNAKFFGIWAPSYGETIKETEIIKAQKSIKSSLEMANKADLKVVSIGYLGDDCFLVRHDSITRQKLKQLIDKGACGEILCHFYDENGEPVEDELTQRMISVDIPTTSGIIVGVSGGRKKSVSIKAALKGHLVDIIVIDEETCKEVLGTS